MNDTEHFVNEICQKTFLSFWSFPNPIRNDNKKELTDILIVNDPIVIIISVKEISIKQSNNIEVDIGRWLNRAIKKSYIQIYGAERIIKQKITPIFTSDKKHEIIFPAIDKISIYRIGVSVGRKEAFPLPFGDFETGFVHFFDQESFPLILNELDTIADFINYIESKEKFYKSNKLSHFQSEEDLLAIYLHNGRKFPDNFDTLFIEPHIWFSFIKNEFYKRRELQKKESYLWDSIIQEFYNNYSKEQLLFDTNLTEIESALRVMSKETRFSRMMLARSFLEFVGFYYEPKSRSRISISEANVTYVFLLDSHRDDDREFRTNELSLRCLVARVIHINNPTVVGIATNKYINGTGHSYDLCCLNLPSIDNDFIKRVKKMQSELKYFINPLEAAIHYDEYPK